MTLGTAFDVFPLAELTVPRLRRVLIFGNTDHRRTLFVRGNGHIRALYFVRAAGCRGYADRAIAIEVIIEARFQALQRRAVSRNRLNRIGDVVAGVIQVPDGVEV